MKEKGTEFEELNIEADREGWKALLKYWGMEKPTVPQVLSRNVSGSPVMFRLGGYEDMVEYYERNL